jgi:hypothetical protein
MSLMSWFLSAFEPPPRHRPAAVKVETRRSDSYREAEERAEELLRSWLSVEQLAQYGIFGYFVAVGSDTGKRYRICRGRVFNIKELDADGREYCTWCLAPEGVTTGDVNLAQKIALENFENQALRIANRSSASIWQSVQRPSEPRSWMQWR